MSVSDALVSDATKAACWSDCRSARMLSTTARQPFLVSVEAAEATATLTFDDSKLAKTKKLIAELNKQLDVRERQASLEGQVNGLIPVEEATESTEASITNRIDDYFDPKTDTGSSSADESVADNDS